MTRQLEEERQLLREERVLFEASRVGYGTCSMLLHVSHTLSAAVAFRKKWPVPTLATSKTRKMQRSVVLRKILCARLTLSTMRHLESFNQ